MNNLTYTTAYVSSYLQSSYDNPVTVADLRHFLQELDRMQVPDDAPVEECLISVVIDEKATCDLIPCGNHDYPEEVFDVIINTHTGCSPFVDRNSDALRTYDGRVTS